jgi:hypothetical protein
MRVLTENPMQCEVCPPHCQSVVETSYTDFLATHPPTFAEATDPLEADNWLCIIKSKFGLLHCTEALFDWASNLASRLWKPEVQTNMKLFGLSFSPLEAHESSGYMRSSEDEENRLRWACNTYL